MLTLDKIRHAQEVLADAVYRTDIVRAQKLYPECDLRIKTENLQRTGSFKLRGAYYKMACLSPEEKEKGVIACSAGNHAQGVALAATRNGIKSLICLPAGAPLAKISATKDYGADVCLVQGVYDDAYQHALKLRDECGYTFIHPFDDEDVIAGQGTIGLEILEQWKDVEAIIVPVGGGGLISGVAFAVKAVNPSVQVYGVQAAGAPSMYNSLISGKIETLPSVSTIADGIAVKQPGVHTFEYCKKYVDGIVTVTDGEIAAAILALIEKKKIVAEGAGATPVAAMLAGKLPQLTGKKVCCLVSGGNVDVTILSRFIQRGLYMSGRKYNLTLEISDKSGQLAEATQVIAGIGANILNIDPDQSYVGKSGGGYMLRFELETHGFEHIEEIKDELTKAGFRIL